VLQELVDVHGAPLVVKSDNGTPLIGAEVRALMQLHRIEPLRSPVRRPSYNGACEAMVGEVKRAAADLALQHGGSAGRWLPRAGELLNGYEREDIGVPESLWEARLGASGRRDMSDLRRALGRRLKEIRGLAPLAACVHATATKVQRSSLRQALCELQILKIERP
jgi:hypothetical protein